MIFLRRLGSLVNLYGYRRIPRSTQFRPPTSPQVTYYVNTEFQDATFITFFTLARGAHPLHLGHFNAAGGGGVGIVRMASRFLLLDRRRLYLI